MIHFDKLMQILINILYPFYLTLVFVSFINLGPLISQLRATLLTYKAFSRCQRVRRCKIPQYTQPNPCNVTLP